MAGFNDGIDWEQVTLFLDRLKDWISEDHLVRAVGRFVAELNRVALGFERCRPARTGRPGYHPSALLKLFIYSYLNRFAFQPSAGTRSGPQCRADVAARPLGARSQDHRILSAG